MTNWFKKDFFTLFFGIFALVGTILGIVGGTVWYTSSRLTREGVRTTGTVVALVGQSSKAPVVEYTTTGGGRHTYQSATYSSPPAYQVGEPVTLWYDREDPENAMLAGLDRWLLPGIMGGFFLVFGGLGYGGLAYRWLKKRDQAWLLHNGQPHLQRLATTMFLVTTTMLSVENSCTRYRPAAKLPRSRCWSLACWSTRS